MRCAARLMFAALLASAWVVAELLDDGGES